MIIADGNAINYFSNSNSCILTPDPVALSDENGVIAVAEPYIRTDRGFIVSLNSTTSLLDVPPGQYGTIQDGYAYTYQPSVLMNSFSNEMLTGTGLSVKYNHTPLFSNNVPVFARIALSVLKNTVVSSSDTTALTCTLAESTKASDPILLNPNNMALRLYQGNSPVSSLLFANNFTVTSSPTDAMSSNPFLFYGLMSLQNDYRTGGSAYSTHIVDTSQDIMLNLCYIETIDPSTNYFDPLTNMIVYKITELPSDTIMISGSIGIMLFGLL